MSSANVSEILSDFTNDFMKAEDGKRLTGDIDINIEGILQNAFVDNAIVEHRWSRYGEVRADIIIVKTTIAGLLS